MSDTQTATVAADQFMRAVTNAALSASTDDTLPLLTAVHFRPSPQPGFLQLEATNRYVASQEEIPLADLDSYDSDWGPSQVASHMEAEHGWQRPEPLGPYSGETMPTDIERQHTEAHAAGGAGHQHSTRPVPVTELDVIVNVKDLGKLVKTLRLVIEPGTKYASPGERPHVVISAADGEDKVSFTLVQNMGTDTTISPRRVDGNFVPIDRLMTDETGEVSEIAFNPAYLAIFTKVDPGQKNTTVKFRFTAPGKPVQVQIGEHYRALIVPINGA